MPESIRTADLERDRAELIPFFRENLLLKYDAERFDWLYVQNPIGRARAWLAMDEEHRIIGTSAAFPRCVSVAGSVRRAWVLGDFCIAKQYRSLGLAIRLQRETLQGLTADPTDLWYDFPSRVMMSVYMRLGIRQLGKQIRFVKLLRADDKVQKLTKSKTVAMAISHFANIALDFQRSPVSSGDIEFSLLQGPFGKEFDSIHNDTDPHTVVGSRSADYLNWRYCNNPLRRYLVVVARKQGEILGYAVVENDSLHPIVADIRCTNSKKLVIGLLAYIEKVLRKQNAYSISLCVLENCHLIPYLSQAGLVAREDAPVFGDSNPTKDISGSHDSRAWMLFYGDRD